MIFLGTLSYRLCFVVAREVVDDEFYLVGCCFLTFLV